MRAPLRKIAIAIAAAITIFGIAAALPTAADAAWHGHGGGGHWHGGGGHWHGGWGGWGFGTGLALGFGAPYYGGYYAYDPYPYGGCVMRHRPVINRDGHRVWRGVRVCY